jgi:phage terminase large subunit-like protein
VQDEATVELPIEYEIALEVSILTDSLYDFVKEAFHVVETDPFVDGWHIQAVCKTLEALYHGQVTKQIINIPIGHMKSLLVNVFFPAWVWAKDPTKKFLFLSYGEDLVIRDTGKCKRLIQSEWYQQRFGLQLSSTPDTTTKFGNVKGGWRYAYGFSGAYTGQHADFVCIDDPLKAGEADSEAARNEVNDKFDNAAYNRMKPKTGRMVIIMQRLHENDLCGHIEEKKLDFEWLVLPAEYEGMARFKSSIGIVDLRAEIGEVLWAGRYDRQTIDDLKRTMSERGVAGQLQQRPAPLGGYTFKKDWFRTRYSQQDIRGIYLSVDGAFSTTEESAKSAILVAGLTAEYRLIPMFAWADKVVFPDFVNKIVEVAHTYLYNLYGIVIEAKASGISAMQTIKRNYPDDLADLVHAFTPPANLKKEERATVSSKWCENGSVILPELADENKEWLIPLEEELFNFPSGRYKDLTDCLVQLIFMLEPELSDGYLYGQGRK